MIQGPDLVKGHLRFRAPHKVRDQDGFWKAILPFERELRRTCVRVLVVARMELADYDHT